MELKEAMQVIRTLHDAGASIEEAHDALERERKGGEKTLSGLRSEIARAQADRDEMLKQAREARDDAGRARGERNDENEKLARVRADLASAQVELDTVRKAIATVKSSIARLG